MVNSKFKLLRLLGVGGMAAVYEACHRNGKRVALKLLHPALSLSERQRKRFLREAYVANTIGHQGVVQIHDDGIDTDGTAYLVMELLEGETLAAAAKARGGRLPVGMLLDIADQVLDVLAAAHTRGVVHRDIKPENIFLMKSGHVKVLDFGIARLFDHVPGATVHTQDGSMLGTPAFMAQEQARGRWDEVDHRTDLWAVGATLFTLVTGELVHAADTPNEQLGKAMTMPARRLADLHPDLPKPFGDAVDCALRFEQAQRWRDALCMQEALRAAWDDEVAQAVSERESHAPSVQNAGGGAWQRVTESVSVLGLSLVDRRTRRRRLFGLALAGALVLTLVAAFAGQSDPDPKPATLRARAPAAAWAGNGATAAAGKPPMALRAAELTPALLDNYGQEALDQNRVDFTPQAIAPLAAREPRPGMTNQGARARGVSLVQPTENSHKHAAGHIAALPPDPLDRRH